MIRTAALVTLAVAAVGLVVTGPTASAGAQGAPPPPDHFVAVPLGTINDMLVDQAANQVFYAGVNVDALSGTGDVRGIAVSDLDGGGMHLVTGTSRSDGLTLGPDGLVYAAEHGSDIAAINPTTLAITKYSTAPAGCPTSLAFVGAQLWFSFECSQSDHQGLATLDTATKAVRAYPTIRRTLWPRVASVPNHPHLLVGSDLTAAGRLSLFDVSGEQPSEIATATTSSPQRPEGLLGGARLAVTPDGGTVLASSYGLLGAATFSTSDLSPGTLTYRSALPSTAAISDDGGLIAVGSGLAGGSTLSIFRSGSARPIRTYAGSPIGASQRHSPAELAWSGSTLLAVYVNDDGRSPLLNVLHSALQAPSTLTFSGPASVRRATPVTLAGQLVGLPSTPIVITKRDLAGAHALGTTVTDANGRFTVHDLPRVGGSNTYVARYLGDQTHGPVGRSAVVAVSRGTVPLSVRIDRNTYNFHDIARVSIHLAAHDVKKVQLWVQIPDNGMKFLQTLTVDSHGNASYRYRMAFNTDFVVKFYGDYYYNPRQVGVIGRTRVLVTQYVYGVTAMAGPYIDVCCTALVNGIVAPKKMFGGNVAFQVEQLLAGGWHAAPAPSGAELELGGDGSTQASFSRSQLGYYRIRSVFHSDNGNVGNVSAWTYIKFAGHG